MLHSSAGLVVPISHLMHGEEIWQIRCIHVCDQIGLSAEVVKQVILIVDCVIA